MAETEFKYDVFISYSHKDEDLADKVLRQRLDDAGLKVCIDYRDFEAGKMALLNMQDAAMQSKHVVLVLTRNWLNSEWSFFEALMGGTQDPAGLQKKLIPLLCEDGILKDINPFIAMRTWVDFVRKDRDEIAWKQLFTALDKPNTAIVQASLEQSIDRYRQRVRHLHSKIRLLNKESAAIDSFYVELSIASGLSSKHHHKIIELEKKIRDSRTFPKQEKLSDIQDLISAKNKIFLSGKPGSGKTTLLKHITVLAAKGKIDKLPIFISLTNWANNSQSLMLHIAEQFEVCGFSHAESFIESLLNDGGAIVLLDGFDEIVEEKGKRRQVRDEILKFVDKHSNNKIIISCRNAASNYQFDDFSYVEIADFDDTQANAYINNWFSADPIIASSFITQIEQPQHWNIKELFRLTEINLQLVV